MKRHAASFFLSLLAAGAAAGPPPLLWTTHGNRSADSIPAGNGDIGVNVWTEEDGDLLLYVGKTDAFDESGRLLKLGRLRIHFSNNPFAKGNAFRQELNLRDGVIEIRSSLDPRPLTLLIWVDAHNPVIHIEAESDQPFEQTVALEMWRTEKRPLRHKWEAHATDGMSASEPPMQFPDTVASVSNRIVWYHHNATSVYPVTLQVQDLTDDGRGGRDGLPPVHGTAGRRSLPSACGSDPLLNRILGCAVTGDGFVSEDSKRLKTTAPTNRTHLIVSPLTLHPATAAEWVAAMTAQVARMSALPPEETRTAHRQWWNDFWQRSWVRVSGGDTNETAAITLGWHANRYLAACTGRGNAPIKFNGAIFNVDGIDANGQPCPDCTADARMWGPGFWFQNQRHIYWPMLQAGDYEQLLPFFKMYRDALPLARQRTKAYYGHDGVFFPETMYLWGAYLNGDCGYGWNRAGKELGLTDNGYIRRYWQGGLELTAMMLEYYRHTGDDAFLRETLLPIAAEIVTFYDLHYKRDASGKLRFEPAQMLETIWDVVNPMPEIAGLNCCLAGLLALPEALTTEPQRVQWKRVLGELPALPMTQVGETPILGLADEIRGGKHNLENGHLYAVWPYRQHGVGVGDLKLAQDSYAHRWHKGGPYQCWINDTVFAAYCGLAAEATDHLAFRFVRTDGLRFPAFYTHGDWVPDLDNGGVCQNTIQSMLMQTVGSKICLLPAWPKNWDCEFKLHAPLNTTVEGVYRAGKLEQLKVAPESRRRDVLLPP
jgi:alpha-L-fucosidase 2